MTELGLVTDLPRVTRARHETAHRDMYDTVRRYPGAPGNKRTWTGTKVKGASPEPPPGRSVNGERRLPVANPQANTLHQAPTVENPRIRAKTTTYRHEATPMLPRLLNTEEVCEYLGISTATLRKMHKRGTAPPYITMGNATRRYPEDQLAAWVAAHSDAAPPDPPPAANEETSKEATGTAS